MDEARLLTAEKTGTVIAAGEQSAGRGRSGRYWKMSGKESLAFTIILHYGSFEAIPRCLTLKTGLAVALAIEDFINYFANSQNMPFDRLNKTDRFCGINQSCGKVLVKWPNDIMLSGKDGSGRKAGGILAEAEGGTVYIGIGVNIAQKSFPPELAGKACSIVQILSETTGQNVMDTASLAAHRFTLLEMILSGLYRELETAGNISLWRSRLEEKLYMKGQHVNFVPGLPEELVCTSPAPAIEGTLLGIGENGEICIKSGTGGLLSFVTGELKI
jgi:BirA family biotin operon repressor/biotin-[acetyl-CoA-carboxylase] ligase